MTHVLDELELYVLGVLPPASRAEVESHLVACADCGAEAMLCLPIAVEGKAWGLAVCRHHAPRRLTLERLGTAELFIDMVALRMGLAERA